MTEWWNSIPGPEKIYWYFAFPFTALFIVQTVLVFIGMGDSGDLGDGEFDEHAFEDTSSPFHLLTIRNFIIFFTVFAWTGIIASKSGMNRFLAVVVSIVSGLIVAAIISSIFYFMMKLTENGGMDLKNAVNCVGEVYLIIPAKRKGTGKVTITLQGVSTELDAVTDGRELPTGSKVKVVGVVDNRVLLVEKNI